MHENPARARIRVRVADDTRIHTELLVASLRNDPSLDVAPWQAEGNGLHPISDSHDFDVLLISSHLEEQPRRGLDFLRAVRSVHPEARAVVLLGSSRDELVLEAFRAGARGVFSKQESIDTLSKCIRCVHQGQIWANSRGMSLAITALASSPKVHAVDASGLSLLSKRELEVVSCLAEGLSNREIAERLSLSQHTIKNYLFKVFDKLGVSSRVELLSMTLAQDNNSGSMCRDMLSASRNSALQDAADLLECKQAAQQGGILAQVALAQWYEPRTAEPQDLIQAYTWYRIANDRIASSLNALCENMTPDQILEAEKKAAIFRSKAEKVFSSVGRISDDALPPSAACAD